MLGLAISGLFSIGKRYLAGRQESKKRKDELKAAKHAKRLEQISQGNTAASDLDAISLAQVGFKDEFLLLVGFIPVIMCFFPSMVEHVNAGFAALETMPEWFKLFIAAVVVHSLGFRRMILPAWNAYVRAKWGKIG